MSKKDSGENREELISDLVQNNKSFKDKTRFTQEKFVRHKQKKHGGRIRILKPSLKTITTQMLSRDQRNTIMEVQQLATILRLSSKNIISFNFYKLSSSRFFGLIYSLANIHANANVLLCESTAGLLTGAILGEI